MLIKLIGRTHPVSYDDLCNIHNLHSQLNIILYEKRVLTFFRCFYLDSL
jgi:hypothetical protein